jgi:predicted enzyme related to lactoylglutathione lyase
VGSAFSHLVVHVRDLRRTRHFYEDLLGLAVVPDGGGLLLGGDGFQIAIEERPAHDVGAAGVEIVVRVPDLDEAFERLRDAGIDVTAPVEQPSGGRRCWLHDPDGYRLSINTLS